MFIYFASVQSIHPELVITSRALNRLGDLELARELPAAEARYRPALQVALDHESISVHKEQAREKSLVLEKTVENELFSSAVLKGRCKLDVGK